MVRCERLRAAASGGDVKARIVIVAALPREVAALVRGWEMHRERRQDRQRRIFIWSSPEVIVVAAGMGAARAALAVEAALAYGPVAHLISVGLAGSCDPNVPVGSVLEATEVIDVRSGERFRTAVAAAGLPGRTLATGASIAGVREKARLFAAYGAAAVDMEAATVARLALSHAIPFRAIKAISDDHAFELVSLGKFQTRHGHFDTLPFALHTAVRPHTWRQTLRLARHSQQALDALTAALVEEVRPKS